MNVWNRSFTARERVLILVLSLILLGLVYFKVVDEPVRAEINGSLARQQELQFDIDEAQAQLARLEAMKAEMDAQDGASTSLVAERMPSYNYRNEETALINQIFAGTEDFYLGFYDVKREGDQLRRDFTIRFTAQDYRRAAAILEDLENCGIRCLIGDVSCQVVNNREGRWQEAQAYDNSIQAHPVTVSLTGTFYETVQGGTPDRELPPLPEPQQ